MHRDSRGALSRCRGPAQGPATSELVKGQVQPVFNMQVIITAVCHESESITSYLSGTQTSLIAFAAAAPAAAAAAAAMSPSSFRLDEKTQGATDHRMSKGSF